MGEVNLFDDLEIVTVAYPRGRCSPLADAIHCQNGGILKRRWVKRTGGMTEMMFRKKKVMVPVKLAMALNLPLKKSLLKEFLANPNRDRHLERAQTLGSHSEICLKQSFKFQERLVVENDIVDVFEGYALRFQTIRNSMGGETRVVLLTGKALFLRSGDKLTVAHQCRCAVMIES